MKEKDIKRWMDIISELADNDIAPRLSDAVGDGVYEDIPEIDDARSLLQDAWQLLSDYVEGETA
tara:strand:+ start:263 stop:454 length:192 start_codon:yes stop_codon:yes gene_type:complete